MPRFTDATAAAFFLFRSSHIPSFHSTLSTISRGAQNATHNSTQPEVIGTTGVDMDTFMSSYYFGNNI